MRMFWLLITIFVSSVIKFCVFGYLKSKHNISLQLWNIIVMKNIVIKITGLGVCKSLINFSSVCFLKTDLNLEISTVRNVFLFHGFYKTGQWKFRNFKTQNLIALETKIVMSSPNLKFQILYSIFKLAVFFQSVTGYKI